MSAIPNDKPFNVGVFFVGVDLGQKWDHSAIAVLRKDGDIVSLVHMKRFKLGTEYGVVLGYLKLLERTLQTVKRVYIDRTGVGEFFVEQSSKEVKNVRGIMLSLPEKQDIMVCMKREMEKGHLRIPYDSDLINEINVERYEQTQTNQTKFSHPNGTHDDRLWALALAIYASKPEIPKWTPFAVGGHVSKPRWQFSELRYPFGNYLNPYNQATYCGTCGRLTTSDHEKYHKK